MQRAVFLDRDGTVNVEVDHLDDPAGLCLIAGAAEAIRLLNEAAVPAILITNQAGVGRGLFSEEVVHAIHQELARQLAAHGAHLDAIYYCPHHPDAGCACRKPQPGMLLQAASEHGLDLGRCVIAGDKLSDLEAGRRVGCRTVLVLTGYGQPELAVLEGSDWQPDHVADDLLGAVRWVLGQ